MKCQEVYPIPLMPWLLLAVACLLYCYITTDILMGNPNRFCEHLLTIITGVLHMKILKIIKLEGQGYLTIMS